MNALESWLRSHGVTRAECARRAGLDYRTVCSMCRDSSLGYMYNWKRVADALGCRVDEIVGDK